MPDVRIYIRDAAGEGIAEKRVTVAASPGPVYKDGGSVLLLPASEITDADGLVTFTLDRNEDFLPSTSYYVADLPIQSKSGASSLPVSFRVPSTGGPFDIEDLLIDPPGTTISSALENHIESTSAHPASAITFTPAGSIASVTVQAALEEVASESETTAALAAHAADTTDIHGISDTSALETQAGSAAKVNTHAALTETHGLRQARAAVSVAIASQASVTTTFATAYADTSYSVVATVESSDDLRVRRITGRTASGVTVLVSNEGLAAGSGTLHVVAHHD